MPNILVVDDSPVDRQIVGGLLESDPAIHVQYAQNGADAMTIIEAGLPDVIVTDLQMPEMNGLELIKIVRQQYPQVPVILVTRQGSEQIAVEALKMGAASYVPKQAVGRSLWRTVRSVLQLAAEHKDRLRLMERLTKSDCAFMIENDAGLISQLVGYLQDWVMIAGICFESERVRFGVALNEALVNAMEHGNLEVGSHRRTEDEEDFWHLVDQRQLQPPYGNRRIHVDASLTPAGAAIVIRDEGRGFDTSNLPDPDDAANVVRDMGRGILLMRTFMDEVTYNDSGNEVTLVKLNEFKLDDVIMDEEA